MDKEVAVHVLVQGVNDVSGRNGRDRAKVYVQTDEKIGTVRDIVLTNGDIIDNIISLLVGNNFIIANVHHVAFLYIDGRDNKVSV